MDLGVRVGPCDRFVIGSIPTERSDTVSAVSERCANGLFRLDGVSVEVEGRRILDGISLVLPAGCVTVLGGPSGAGKTSRLRLLNRLDAPTVGTGALRGTDLATIGACSLRREVAMVFQQPPLFPGTVTDNLRVFFELARRVLPEPEPEPEPPGGIDLDEAREAFRVLQARETWQSFGAWVKATKPDLGPGIRQRIEMASKVTEGEAEAQRPTRVAVAAALDGLVPPGTVMAMPVSAALPPKRGADAKSLDGFRADTMALICLASLAGLPQISIPVAESHGIPLAIAFVAWRGGDEALVGLAQTLAPYVGRSR